ncbi:TIGR00730 family Rossman fold protein [Chloroflexia bacterium SDU3-3]|nr:TIGR00730 family Rossman fold protein [Chloroflexia bacterium SDU3-3]
MNICVYCASSDLVPEPYKAAARAVGAGIAQRGWGLVYGGGSVGLMGAVARQVHAEGGSVIGIIPQALLDREVGYIDADELVVTLTMRERKRIMDERSDAFVTLPGGFGTLEELLEITTLRQLAYHDKPIFLVNVDGFYDPLLAMFDQIFAQSFAHERHRRLVTVVRSVDEVFAALDAYTPPLPPDAATASDLA